VSDHDSPGDRYRTGAYSAWHLRRRRRVTGASRARLEDAAELVVRARTALVG
jgi:hypothetical protein